MSTRTFTLDEIQTAGRALLHPDDMAILSRALLAAKPGAKTCEPENPFAGPETKTHELKCWRPEFENVKRGEKTFEFRKNDRDFRTGDVLLLREFAPELPADKQSGKTFKVYVRTILHGGAFGVPKGYCVMSIRPLNPAPAASPPASIADCPGDPSVCDDDCRDRAKAVPREHAEDCGFDTDHGGPCKPDPRIKGHAVPPGRTYERIECAACGAVSAKINGDLPGGWTAVPSRPVTGEAVDWSRSYQAMVFGMLEHAATQRTPEVASVFREAVRLLKRAWSPPWTPPAPGSHPGTPTCHCGRDHGFEAPARSDSWWTGATCSHGPFCSACLPTLKPGFHWYAGMVFPDEAPGKPDEAPLSERMTAFLALDTTTPHAELFGFRDQVASLEARLADAKNSLGACLDEKNRAVGNLQGQLATRDARIAELDKAMLRLVESEAAIKADAVLEERERCAAWLAALLSDNYTTKWAAKEGIASGAPAPTGEK